MRKIFTSFVIWSCIFLLTRFCFFYYPYQGEPDMDLVIQGIYRAALSGKELSLDSLYGKSFSFGFYFFIFKLINLHQVLLLHLNAIFLIITLISAFTLIYAVSRVCRDFISHPAQMTSFLVLWLLSPIWWECTTYLHPLLPAVALSFMAALCLRHYPPLGAILFFLSFTLRSETILLLPALFFAAADLKNRKQCLNVSVAIMVPLLLFFIVQHAVVGQETTGASGLMAAFWEKYVRLDRIFVGMAGIILSIGIVSVFFVPLGIYHAIKQKHHRLLIFAALLVIPNLIFWIANPTPFRHFLIVSLGLALTASVIFQAINRKVGIVLLIISISGNAFLPEALVRVVSSSPAAVQPLLAITGHSYTQSSPGSMLFNHTARQRLLAFCAAEYRHIRRQAGDRQNLVILGPYHNVNVLRTLIIESSNRLGWDEINHRFVSLDICDGRRIYYVFDLNLPQSELVKTIIQDIGPDYSDDFTWYVSPYTNPSLLYDEVRRSGVRMLASYDPTTEP